MTTFYGDSSALAKRHVQEDGSTWIQNLLGTPGHSVITSLLSQSELYSACNRRLREGSLPANMYSTIISDIEALCVHEYEMVALTRAIVAHTRLLLEQHSLRAYDAIQLATALIVNQEITAAGFAPLIFLSADDRLLLAAQAEGLEVDSPNMH